MDKPNMLHEKRKVPTYQVEQRPAKFRSHWYPVCPRAKALAALAGTKTLTVATMQTLADVGIYPIDVTPEWFNGRRDSQGLISNTVGFDPWVGQGLPVYQPK